jgi:carbamoyltransferase
MKILGFNSGHDVSYAILENGIPIIHNELERFNRRKCTTGDAMGFLIESLNPNIYKDARYAVHYKPTQGYNYPQQSFSTIKNIVENNGGYFAEPGHHQSHAAAAFFSSEFRESLIITFDGKGTENIQFINNPIIKNTIKSSPGHKTCFTIWEGKENKIEPVYIDPYKISWGTYWYGVTGGIFGLGTGLSTDKSGRGFQGGTVMGMAALGDPNKYLSYFSNICTTPPDDNRPPQWEFLRDEVQKSEQNKFDVAASLQFMTEKTIKEQIDPYVKKYIQSGGKNLCFSGGVALNCVMAGKVFDWYPEIESIHHDPIPYDGGNALGSARYLYHHILDKPRIYNNPQNRTPYLGITYSKDIVLKALDRDDCLIQEVNDDDVLELLNQQNVISVFGGGSESGRRALGNRSILADPRYTTIKDKINSKVKHREWFRPFAPSILREEMKNWFEKDIDSPCMSFAIAIKKEQRDKIQAITHFDGTARVQTVREEDNKWYYNFIKKWNTKTGVPILLNTSFNDREPIVETPEHAINCFLGTDIDYLYFRDYKLLIRKK